MQRQEIIAGIIGQLEEMSDPQLKTVYECALLVAWSEETHMEAQIALTNPVIRLLEKHVG